MKNRITVLTLLVYLIFAVSADAQPKAPKGFEITYDKFKDHTQVIFYDFAFNITFAAWFQYEGTAIEADVDEFLFTFRGGSRCPGFCFKSPSLIFLIDSDRHRLPELDRLLSDTATFTIDRATLTRLAAAKKVEYQVGSFSGEWKEKNIGKLKTLLDLGTVKR